MLLRMAPRTRSPRSFYPNTDLRGPGLNDAEAARLPPALIRYAVLGLLRSVRKGLTFDLLARRLEMETVAERNALARVLDTMGPDGDRSLGYDSWGNGWHVPRRTAPSLRRRTRG